MDTPPVRYVTTSDGYSIAYITSGSGPVLVYLPQVLQHAQLLWTGGSPYRRTFEYWSRRYQVVQYDSRGQGMSQRGVPEDHSMADYVHDLEAVIDALGVRRVILDGSAQFGHVAVQYAVEHPEQVEALILENCNVQGGGIFISSETSDLARANWDFFLSVLARTKFPGTNSEAMARYFRQAADQADFLQLLDAGRRSNIASLAPRVQAPTLLIAGDAVDYGPGDWGRLLAPLIPDAQLVTRDQSLAREGESTQLALLVESFLDDLAARKPITQPDTVPASADGLSTREIEVLRLIAKGKSNPQIAEELVLSINTVQRHVSNILAKTGLANRTEAASYATRHGLA
jgi:DNA-binding CsgD family transcriptional regulator